MTRTAGLPAEADVVIDVPRLGFVKRNEDGSVDYVSPFPCPFNYGHVPGVRADDGDHQDAIVLGPRLERGERVRVPVRATVDYTDAGKTDTKWVCSPWPLSRSDRLRVVTFFRMHALAKSVLNGLRREPPGTRFGGLRE